MDTEELIAGLWSVKLGQVITVNDSPFPVEEIVRYQEGKDKWLDLVRYDKKGLEIALEVEGEEISLWLEVDDITGVVANTIDYQGETYTLDKNNQGKAMTACSYIEDGEEAREAALTPYAVFNAPSGRRLCREVWDGEDKWYLAGLEVPKVSI